MLDAKANVNVRGKKDATALHLACEKGDVERVQLLLERNAEVDAPSSHGNTWTFGTPRDGMVTPLLLAARHCPRRDGNINKRKKYTAIMRELVKRGASTNKEKMYDWSQLDRNFRRYDIKSMMLDEKPRGCWGW